jgi:hypothetical protein
MMRNPYVSQSSSVFFASCRFFSDRAAILLQETGIPRTFYRRQKTPVPAKPNQSTSRLSVTVLTLCREASHTQYFSAAIIISLFPVHVTPRTMLFHYTTYSQIIQMLVELKLSFLKQISGGRQLRLRVTGG